MKYLLTAYWFLFFVALVSGFFDSYGFHVISEWRVYYNYLMVFFGIGAILSWVYFLLKQVKS